MLGFGYILLTPAIDVVLYLTLNTNSDNDMTLKIIYILWALNVIFLWMSLSYMCSTVTDIAHYPIKIMYQILGTGRPNVRTRLLIESFMLRLNSKTIGFYYFSWFALTRHEFMKYIVFVCSCFMLTYGIIQSKL